MAVFSPKVFQKHDDYMTPKLHGKILNNIFLKNKSGKHFMVMVNLVNIYAN
jgi:hypothetical protein